MQTVNGQTKQDTCCLQKSVLLDTEASAEVPDVKGHGGKRHGKDDDKGSGDGAGSAASGINDTVSTYNAEAGRRVPRDLCQVCVRQSGSGGAEPAPRRPLCLSRG